MKTMVPGNLHFMKVNVRHGQKVSSSTKQKLHLLIKFISENFQNVFFTELREKVAFE